MNHCILGLEFSEQMENNKYLCCRDRNMSSTITKTEHPSAADWPVAANFDPEDVFVSRLLPSLAVIAVPAAFRHLDVQTLAVEGSGTGLAAQQAAPCSMGGGTSVSFYLWDSELYSGCGYERSTTLRITPTTFILYLLTYCFTQSCPSPHDYRHSYWAGLDNILIRRVNPDLCIPQVGRSMISIHFIYEFN